MCSRYRALDSATRSKGLQGAWKREGPGHLLSLLACPGLQLAELPCRLRSEPPGAHAAWCRRLMDMGRPCRKVPCGKRFEVTRQRFMELQEVRGRSWCGIRSC